MKSRNQRSDTPLNGLLLGWSEATGGNALTPIWDTAREGHLITIAPTGAGKGVSCAIPALLTWHGPAIVVDPRGENYAVTAARRRAMGHIVYRLDPFCVCDRSQGDSLNPLDLIDPNADDFEDNAAVVAQLCMQEGTTLTDRFWDERATAMITKVICELFNTMQRRPTMKDVQAGLRGLPIREVEFEGALEQPGLPLPSTVDKALRKIVHASEFSSDRTRSSIMATANGHLGFMRSPAVHASLTASTIALEDITGGAMHTIYIVIPPDKLTSHSKLLRLWLGVMLAAISRRRRAPSQPTLFLIDEAAQLGEMNDLRSALTLMRAYGMRVWTFWQCLSQLKTVYPKDWESILNNSSIQQFFGANTPYSRRLLHEFIGDDFPGRGINPERQVLFSGGATMNVRRVNYLQDPILKGLASPHPFHLPQQEITLQ